jgi:hypothetical protein
LLDGEGGWVSSRQGVEMRWDWQALGREDPVHGAPVCVAIEGYHDVICSSWPVVWCEASVHTEAVVGHGVDMVPVIIDGGFDDRCPVAWVVDQECSRVLRAVPCDELLGPLCKI